MCTYLLIQRMGHQLEDGISKPGIYPPVPGWAQGSLNGKLLPVGWVLYSCLKISYVQKVFHIVLSIPIMMTNFPF